MSETAFLLVADLLGFGKIVKNLPTDDLHARMIAWTTLVETTAKAQGLDRLQLISDTIFLAAPSSEHGLLSLIHFSRELLVKGIEQSFPVRGAIVHGEYTWGNLLYGPAVVAGHALEQSQNWVGISCAPALPFTNSLWALDRLVCYLPPLKGAPIQLHPVVSWDIPPTEGLFKAMTSHGLSKLEEIMTWEFGEKATNTILFRLYQEHLKAHRLPCAQFAGLLPIHPIEGHLAH